MIMIQCCTSPIWALSLCSFRITPLCTIWEIHTGYKVAYLLRFYHFFTNSQKVSNFYHFSSIRFKTRSCIPSICVLSFCGWITTLQCMLWEMQPGYKFECLSFFYEFTKVYHFYNCSSIQTKTRHCTPSILFYPFAGWQQHCIVCFGRYSLDTRSNIHLDYINFYKSNTFTIFHWFEQNHNVAHFQYLLYPFAD